LSYQTKTNNKMENLKHTSGTWHINKNMPGYGNSICISRQPQSDYWNDGHVNIVGDCPLAIIKDGNDSWKNKYPAEANAKLIASAPELLEALIMCVNYVGSISNESEPAINAINKATK